jgi:hypothetical protein
MLSMTRGDSYLHDTTTSSVTYCDHRNAWRAVERMTTHDMPTTTSATDTRCGLTRCRPNGRATKSSYARRGTKTMPIPR